MWRSVVGHAAIRLGVHAFHERVKGRAAHVGSGISLQRVALPLLQGVLLKGAHPVLAPWTIPPPGPLPLPSQAASCCAWCGAAS